MCTALAEFEAAFDDLNIYLCGTQTQNFNFSESD